jgi:hypothetical protein
MPQTHDVAEVRRRVPGYPPLMLREPGKWLVPRSVGRPREPWFSAGTLPGPVDRRSGT